MRVLHVIKAKGIAGAERHLLDLLEGLRARDIDARLLLLSEPDYSAKVLGEAAIARGIPTHTELIYRTLNPGLLRRLRDHFREAQPQVVHTHLIHADLYAIPAARWARVPVIVSSRHNDDPRRRRPHLRLLNRALWAMTDAGIPISDAVKRFTVAVEGVPARKLHTIHYGLPLPVTQHDRAKSRAALLTRLTLPDDALITGMVCRLMDAKGLPDAIDAVARLRDELPSLHLVIAGEGPLRDALERQVTRLKLSGRVHFLGWVAQPLPLIAGLDLLLMPSLREGFGLTLLEAMGQAVPVIGSTASAIPEVIAHGETGLLVPPRDPAALADAMRVLLSDKPLRMHMGLLGQDRLETHFSAARMVDETLALYQRLSN